MAFRVHSGTYLARVQSLARCLPVFQQKGALSATSPPTWKEYPDKSAYGSRNIPLLCEEGNAHLLPEPRLEITECRT